MSRVLLDIPKFLSRQRSFPSGFQQEIRSSRILYLLDGQLGHHVWIGLRHGDCFLMAGTIFPVLPLVLGHYQCESTSRVLGGND
jgi:hypothetical protein